MSNEDHKEIYLQPECCAGEEGRLWCQDPDPVDCEDGKPWTRYVRADTRDNTIDKLRGQLQNAANHLERSANRANRVEQAKLKAAVEQANKCLYETL